MVRCSSGPLKAYHSSTKEENWLSLVMTASMVS